MRKSDRAAPATELEVELSPRGRVSSTAKSVHKHMPSQEGDREKEQAKAAVSRIYRYQGSLVFA